MKSSNIPMDVLHHCNHKSKSTTMNTRFKAHRRSSKQSGFKRGQKRSLLAIEGAQWYDGLDDIGVNDEDLKENDDLFQFLEVVV